MLTLPYYHVINYGEAGTGFCCDLKICECKPGTEGAVKTNIYTMAANGNTVLFDEREGVKPSERYKVIGDLLPSNFDPNGKPEPDFSNDGGICTVPLGHAMTPPCLARAGAMSKFVLYVHAHLLVDAPSQGWVSCI